MKALFEALRHAIFIGEPTWAWRRRITVSGGLLALAGVANSIWWDADIAHASMVMTNCAALFTAILAAFGTMAVVDDHLKRKAEAEREQS